MAESVFQSATWIREERPFDQTSFAPQSAFLPPPADRYLLGQHLFKRTNRRKVSMKAAQQFIELGGILGTFSLGDEECGAKDAVLKRVASRPTLSLFGSRPGRQPRVAAIRRSPFAQ